MNNNHTLADAQSLAWGIFLAKPKSGVAESARKSLVTLKIDPTEENIDIVAGGVVEFGLGLESPLGNAVTVNPSYMLWLFETAVAADAIGKPFTLPVPGLECDAKLAKNALRHYLLGRI